GRTRPAARAVPGSEPHAGKTVENHEVGRMTPGRGARRPPTADRRPAAVAAPPRNLCVTELLVARQHNRGDRHAVRKTAFRSGIAGPAVPGDPETRRDVGPRAPPAAGGAGLPPAAAHGAAAARRHRAQAAVVGTWTRKSSPSVAAAGNGGPRAFVRSARLLRQSRNAGDQERGEQVA